MATVVKKKFVGFDALGTDGTDFKKMAAIYRVVDSDGFSYSHVRISATIHNGKDSNIINDALENEINKTPM